MTTLRRLTCVQQCCALLGMLTSGLIETLCHAWRKMYAEDSSWRYEIEIQSGGTQSHTTAVGKFCGDIRLQLQ